jgi:hypothetical protein
MDGERQDTEQLITELRELQTNLTDLQHSVLIDEHRSSLLAQTSAALQEIIDSVKTKLGW